MTYLNSRTICQLSSAHQDFLNYQVRMELERQRIWSLVSSLPMEETASTSSGDRVVTVTAASEEELKSVCRFPHLRYLGERALNFGAIEYIQFSVKGEDAYRLPIGLIFMNPLG